METHCKLAPGGTWHYWANSLMRPKFLASALIVAFRRQDPAWSVQVETSRNSWHTHRYAWYVSMWVYVIICAYTHVIKLLDSLPERSECPSAAQVLLWGKTCSTEISLPGLPTFKQTWWDSQTATAVRDAVGLQASTQQMEVGPCKCAMLLTFNGLTPIWNRF
jgi:hypothetical protein